MSKNITKPQAELEKLLEQRETLSRQIGTLWQELRMLRLAAIRGGDDPGALPHFVGLDPQWRAGQHRGEEIARQNREGIEAARRDPHLQHLFSGGEAA